MSAAQPRGRDPLLPSRRTRRRWTSIQAAAIAGLVCAICWTAAILGLSGIPGLDASPAEVVRFYATGGTSLDAVALLQVLVLGNFGFLWFVGVVRARLGLQEPKMFGTVFLGGSILLAGLLFLGTAALAAPTVLLQVGGVVPEPGAASMSQGVSSIILTLFVPKLATLVILSASSLGLRTGALPRWLVVVSYAVGIGSFVTFTVSQPMVYVMPAWIAVVSVVMLVHRAPARGSADPGQSPAA
jgi:hypothetical protein